MAKLKTKKISNGLKGLRMIKEPNWKYLETKTTLINVIDIDTKHHEVDALDMEKFLPFCLDVVDDVLFDEIEKGHNYRARIRVFKAMASPEEKEEMDKELPQEIKEMGGISELFKFELISVDEE
jgi:hypothetical protein